MDGEPRQVGMTSASWVHGIATSFNHSRKKWTERIETVSMSKKDLGVHDPARM